MKSIVAVLCLAAFLFTEIGHASSYKIQWAKFAKWTKVIQLGKWKNSYYGVNQWFERFEIQNKDAYETLKVALENNWPAWVDNEDEDYSVINPKYGKLYNISSHFDIYD